MESLNPLASSFHAGYKIPASVAVSPPVRMAQPLEGSRAWLSRIDQTRSPCLTRSVDHRPRHIVRRETLWIECNGLQGFGLSLFQSAQTTLKGSLSFPVTSKDARL